MLGMTRLLSLSAHAPAQAPLAEAAALLCAGGLVAFPTETVYGLGANAYDATAVARIFAAKQRPAADPLIVHLATATELPGVVGPLAPATEHLVARLAAAFWPGPLTLVLPRGARIPPAVCAGRATVAVRVPAHPVAHALLAAAGTPIAAPSANRFGHTSPTTAAHVLADLDGCIDLVLDAGPTPLGLESTVLDLTAAVPTVLRPGGVDLAALQAAIGSVWGPAASTAAAGAAPQAGDHSVGLPAPGLLERHYAPDSTLWLVVDQPEAARAWLHATAHRLLQQGQRVGLLICDEDAALLAELVRTPGVAVELLGPADDLPAIAQRLYAALRALDARRPDVILARDFGSVGLALAIGDRLRRAASGRVFAADG